MAPSSYRFRTTDKDEFIGIVTFGKYTRTVTARMRRDGKGNCTLAVSDPWQPNGAIISYPKRKTQDNVHIFVSHTAKARIRKPMPNESLSQYLDAISR